MIIFADFNNFDSDGFIRLDCVGTIDALNEHSIVLAEGMHMTVSDGDLTAEIRVRAPGEEGVWRGQVIGAVCDNS